MSTVLSTSVASTNTLVQGLSLENSKNCPPEHSGRSVNEVSGGHCEIAGTTAATGTTAAKGCVQSELNQNHSEIIAMQWQSHCQFYSECSHCLRLQTKPSIDSTTQPIVIINTSESCKRIKPKRNVRRRIFVEPLTEDNQELVTEATYFSSRTASISTGTPFGNSFTPTAARAG